MSFLFYQAGFNAETGPFQVNFPFICCNNWEFAWGIYPEQDFDPNIDWLSLIPII